MTTLVSQAAFVRYHPIVTKSHLVTQDLLYNDRLSKHKSRIVLEAIISIKSVLNNAVY